MFAKYKSVIYESLMVILGCAIFGAGLDAFVLPHKLVSTGISGVGLILYYVTGLSVGSWNMILNIPIFWAAWKWLGTRVVIKTLYGTSENDHKAFIDNTFILSEHSFLQIAISL